MDIPLYACKEVFMFMSINFNRMSDVKQTLPGRGTKCSWSTSPLQPAHEAKMTRHRPVRFTICDMYLSSPIVTKVGDT